MNYTELRKQFKTLLSNIGKEELLKWLEDDEKRVEVERRTGKTERLLDIALKRLNSHGHIKILNSLENYGAPFGCASFLDKNPRDFKNRLKDKTPYILRELDAGDIYLLKPELTPYFEVHLKENKLTPKWVKSPLDWFNFRRSEAYTLLYISYLGAETDNTIYIENGVDFKSTCMDYIKIIE